MFVFRSPFLEMICGKYVHVSPYWSVGVLEYWSTEVMGSRIGPKAPLHRYSRSVLLIAFFDDQAVDPFPI